jgi:hypothetical protein
LDFRGSVGAREQPMARGQRFSELFLETVKKRFSAGFLRQFGHMLIDYLERFSPFFLQEDFQRFF